MSASFIYLLEDSAQFLSSVIFWRLIVGVGIRVLIDNSSLILPDLLVFGDHYFERHDFSGNFVLLRWRLFVFRFSQNVVRGKVVGKEEFQFCM